MKNLKRTTRRFGRLKGHRKGVGSSELLNYVEARKLLYLPTYKWVLVNKVSREVNRIRELSSRNTVILLDYATNPNVEDASSPLSHAALIKAYIEGTYPSFDVPGLPTPERVTDTGETVSFMAGQRVKHPKFGEGTVTFTEGERVKVAFDTDGEKLLAVRYAKLQCA